MRALIAVALLVVAAPGTGRAADLAIVAIPGSAQARTFATPVVPMIADGGLILTNADAAFHSIRSDAIGSDANWWCGPRNGQPEGPANPRRFPLGACPLFWSELSAPISGSRPVFGIDALTPGRAYGFRCGVYETMTGVVLT